MSSTTLYQICQRIFPELAQVAYPDDMDNFRKFREWLNTQHSNIQYVELKEYFDNGIDQCHQLKQANVDIEQLNQQVESEMDQLFENFDEEDQDEWETDPYELTEKALFGNIEKVAKQHNLALLMISNENPYWLLVPNQADLIENLIEAFNVIFNDDGYFKLYQPEFNLDD